MSSSRQQTLRRGSAAPEDGEVEDEVSIVSGVNSGPVSPRPARSQDTLAQTQVAPVVEVRAPPPAGDPGSRRLAVDPAGASGAGPERRESS